MITGTPLRDSDGRIMLQPKPGGEGTWPFSGEEIRYAMQSPRRGVAQELEAARKVRLKAIERARKARNDIPF